MSRSRRNQAAEVLTISPLRGLLARLGRWRGVVTLNYHRIGRPDYELWDHTLWSASAEELDRQLATLGRCAEVIDPCEVLEAMQGGRGRRVLITFDDGYRDNFEIAFPLLQNHGLRAAFFLATGFLDHPRAPWWDEIAWIVRHAQGEAHQANAASCRDCELLPANFSLSARDHDASISELVARYKALPTGEGERFLDQLARAAGSARCAPSDAEGLWMTWEMARQMRAAGMSIGGHTVTHPILAHLPGEHQREEIAGCARRLAEELQVEMRWFAYPVGDRHAFTSTTQGILLDCGVELAFSFYGGFATPTRWNPLDVPRIHVGPGLGPELLEATVALPQIFAR